MEAKPPFNEKNNKSSSILSKVFKKKPKIEKGSDIKDFASK